MNGFLDASAWVIPVVLAITLHEAAHGWMAERFGDDTARMLGRVTFNPIKHIDRFGTIILPGILFLTHAPFLFGYAKPVPVNFYRLRPPRIGMFMVAIAGVTVNMILAMLAGLLLHIDRWLTPEQAPWLFENLYRAIMINCVLTVFNMIPLLPLDGGRVIDSFLSGKIKKLYGRLERYGVWIVMLALILPSLLGLESLSQSLTAPATWLVERVLYLTGNSA